MSMTTFFLIFIVAFLLLFYFGLPDLTNCELPSAGGVRCIDRRDAVIMAIIAAVYACVGFARLGNTESPQSFVSFREGSAEVIELSESTRVDRISVFSGLNVGEFDVEVSNDGENYVHAATFEQNYVAVFKWNNVDLETAWNNVRFIRFSCVSGRPELGEVGVWCGASVLPGSALTDEQALVPIEQNYMNSSYFDEIYHARTADEHLRGVYPYEITHPPLGKLIIALGISIFGLSPFGWRFSGVLFGVLMLPIIYVFVKKLFGGRSVPTACTFVLASDFMHFVQTRIATIDTYAVFFIMLMYLFMYLYVSGESEHPTLMLFLSGLFFGFGAASKWTCLYAGAGLAVIWAADWIINVPQRGLKAFFINCLQCVVFFVLVPLYIYYVSYYPYGNAVGLHGVGMYFDRRYLDIVLNNQDYMFRYHSGVDATHPYSSRWYQWVFDIRPILYYLKYDSDGLRSSFSAWVNPVLCWGGLLSLFVLVYTAIFRKDRQAAFILAGYLAQLMPWMLVKRITFEYHYFPCTVFLVLSLGYSMKLLEVGDKHWKIRLISFAVVSVAMFILFYPTLSGVPIDGNAAKAYLRWLPTWPV